MIAARRKEALDVEPREPFHTQEPTLAHMHHFVKQER